MEEDVLHAVTNAVYVAESDDDVPANQFFLGFDSHGRVLEGAVLTFDSGNRLVIRALKARRKYLRLLE